MKIKKLTAAQKKRWKWLLIGLAVALGAWLIYRRRQQPDAPLLDLVNPFLGGNNRLSGGEGQAFDFSNTGSLMEIDFAYAPATSSGVVEWSKFPEFSLLPGERFLWNGPLRNEQVPLMLRRGVTHIENGWLRTVNRTDVKGKNRYYMIHRRAYGVELDQPNPPVSNYSDQFFYDRTIGDVEGQRSFFQDNAYPEWISEDFEVGNDADGPLVGKWGSVRHAIGLAAKDMGVTLDHYDIYPREWRNPTPQKTPQWQAYEAAGMNATLANSVPYFYLNIPPNGLGNPNDGGGIVAEAIRTESEWFYTILRSIENHRNVGISTVAYMTLGWAQSGFPQNRFGAARPDMFEATTIFSMLAGGKGPALWSEGGATPNFPLTAYEAMIAAAYRMSRLNAFRINSPSYIQPEISVNGGQSWSRLTADESKAAGVPCARGLLKGRSIVIAAYAPKLYEGSQEIKVRYQSFTDTMLLKPYRVNLAATNF